MNNPLSEIEIICLIVFPTEEPLDLEELRYDAQVWLDVPPAGDQLASVVRNIISGPMEVINAGYSG